MPKPKPKDDPARQIVKLDDRGQLSVTLDAEYLLRPSQEAIMEAEIQSGLPLFDLATLAANSRLTLGQMGIVVAAFMRAHGKANPDDPLKSSYLGAKAETLTALIYEAGVPRIMGALAVLLAGAISGGYTASGEAKTSGN